jgi:peptidoglycan/LPS O-acetylase OafA/YrhL
MLWYLMIYIYTYVIHQGDGYESAFWCSNLTSRDQVVSAAQVASSADENEPGWKLSRRIVETQRYQIWYVAVFLDTCTNRTSHN